MLTGLPSLRRAECSYGRQSKLLSALSALPSSARLNLTHLSFRQPPKAAQLQNIAALVPRLTSATVTYHVFEAGYSKAIDEGLQALQMFKGLQDLRLEISTINMLYVIQLGPRLEAIGDKVTNVELVEVEFLHPACLDTISTLPRLTHLTISNPSIIGDSMFLELPELPTATFPSLEHLDYCGPISEQLLTMFTQHSPCLRTLIVKSEHSVLEPACLRPLSSAPRPSLEKLLIEVTVATRGEEWILEMQRVVNMADNLTILGSTDRWGNVSPACVQSLKQFVINKGWALHIV